MRRAFAVVLVATFLLGAASSARAQDGLMGSIRDFLDRTSDKLDENRIAGKIRFSPYVAQRFVYDDNIWLNDKDEADTRGREDDLISDSTVRLGLVLPVNRQYSRMYEEIFGRDELTLLSYEARFLEYAHRSGTDSINQHIRTDLFGFLEDLGSIGLEGRHWIFDVGAEYSDLSDPIDILVRDLQLPGFPPQFVLDEIRRRAVQAHAAIGWRGNNLDAKVGYEFYWLDFANDFFQQANQVSHKGYAEVGFRPPGLEDKRVYLRVSYTDLHFREELLNDAGISEGVIGFEGSLISKKLQFVLEGGWLDWNVDMSGLLGDDNEYRGGVGLARVVYQPWAQRDLKFQIEGRRSVNWSAISNYRVDHAVTFTVFNSFTPKLDGDLTLAWSHHVPSAGPIRTLYEAGVGVTYHLFKQVDLTARYLFRYQNEYREEFLTTADQFGNPVQIQTNGDFYQNVFSVGVEITF